ATTPNSIPMIKISFFSRAALTALVGLSLGISARAAEASPSKAPLGIDASPAIKVAKTGSTKVSADGFLSRWLLLDPIPGQGQVTETAVRAAAQKEYFPDQFTVMPHD